ncbi:MAG: ATP-dependent helicase [Saprospiraceae bacterium]
MAEKSGMQQAAMDYNNLFEAELDRLNPAQREAVFHTEGPVLVIAGPGTGKTHILASRIGHILRSTDTAASSILCLTFTDAGVRAMRQRLLQLIGPEAHKVHIFTFHSFCSHVIQDNLAWFGHHGLEAVTDLEQIEIIRQLLEELPVDHPLRRGKIHAWFYEQHLRELFALMKSEGWSPSHIDENITDYLNDLPNRKAYIYQRKQGPYRAGDLKESQLQKEALRMELLRAAAALFPRYEALMTARRRYDYADMIQWVLQAFQKNEMLLRNYQEQYLYFLVDEYQDTNGAQNELIQRLAAYWDTPNLFIVGDDDQSIFEFQGARLKNLVDFYEQYQPYIKVVLLQQNYRSTQAVLDAAGGLIANNEQRIIHQLAHLGIAKQLQAALPERLTSRVQPIIREYPNRFQEEVDVLRTIIDQHSAGIPWNEMAVIYARHSQVQSLQQMLDKQGIPYQTRRRTHLLDTLLIRQLREMLVYLAEEQQLPFSGDHRLFKLLHYGCFGLPAIDLAQLAAARAALPYEQRPHWRALLLQPAWWPDPLPSRDDLLRIGEWWESMHGQVANLGLPQLVEQVMNGSGLLSNALLSGDRLWKVQVMRSFMEFIRSEVNRQPQLSLAQLIRLLEQVEHNRLILPLQKEIELEDGVHLLTAHSAKGLEFQTVFLLDATQDAWEGKSSRNNRFSLPDTLTRSGDAASGGDAAQAFYVAVTRAKENLFITRATKNAQDKELTASRFVDELATTMNLPTEVMVLPVEELLAYEIKLLQTTNPPHLPALERSAVAKLLEGFQLSVSSWKRYLDCPLSFFTRWYFRHPNPTPCGEFWQCHAPSSSAVFQRDAFAPRAAFSCGGYIGYFFEEAMLQASPYFTPASYQEYLEKAAATSPNSIFTPRILG